MSRATFLRSAATESSRSRISPSGPDEGPLASLRSESAGTNRKDRIGLLSALGFLGYADRAADSELFEIRLRHLPPRESPALLAQTDVPWTLSGRHRINAVIGRNTGTGAYDMRAMLSETPGGPESLKLVELPSKPLGKGQVRVAVRAAGVNFPDTLIIADKYQFKPPRPFAPGHEIAGDIVELGEGATGYKKGDRVIGMIGHGGYATEAVVDVGQLLPMPDNMSYEDGSAFTMTYGTSYYALKQRSSYKPGETLLVTGASGGVGLTAVELGALMGLKVIAAVGSDEKMDVCRKYGATMFVNYAKEKMRDKVKELTSGNGADIIYDAVGGDAFDESVRCIAWYGRLLVVGFAAGRIPSLPANLALLKSCDVRGVFYGAWRGREPAEARKNFDELLRWYDEGKLKPHISMRFPLEKGADAMNALLSRKATGKVVLTMA